MNHIALRKAWYENTAADFDVLIIGAGMVGASLACALGQLSLKVGLAEAVPFPALSAPGYDDRSTALSFASMRIFESLGIWSDLAAEASPIETIHISTRGALGATRIRAAELGVPALGYVVPNRLIGQVLLARVRELADVQILNPARAVRLQQGSERLRVTFDTADGEQDCETRLLVAADGVESPVRRLLGIGTIKQEYAKAAVVANVMPGHPHRHWAYERFTEQGPVAMLPLGERCAMVLTMPADQMDYHLQLSEAEFLAVLQSRFGNRLGRFSQLGRRQGFALSMVRAERLTDRRAVLLGNAAHTIHPVAGQGFNLALREVAILAELLAQAEDVGDNLLLAEYLRRTQHQQRLVMSATDLLSRLFTWHLPGLTTARQLGLIGLDLADGLKADFARRAMGIDAGMPSLARGRSLRMAPIRMSHG